MMKCDHNVRNFPFIQTHFPLKFYAIILAHLKASETNICRTFVLLWEKYLSQEDVIKVM